MRDGYFLSFLFFGYFLFSIYIGIVYLNVGVVIQAPIQVNGVGFLVVGKMVNAVDVAGNSLARAWPAISSDDNNRVTGRTTRRDLNCTKAGCNVNLLAV